MIKPIMRIFLQSFVLILSFIFVFAWQKTPLSQYTIQSLGFLIFLFLITSAKGKNFNSFQSNISLSIFILNTVILLLVFSTGNFTSPLFFLLYFLGFGIAFVFEPILVFLFVLGITLIFLPLTLENNVFENSLRLGSIALISPLAYFFGREYSKSEKQEEQIEKLTENSKDAANEISSNVEEILQDEKKVLKEKDIKRLNNILEETETLREKI